MSHLTHTLSIFAGLLLTGQSHAFDAQAPPDPKTMEWTLKQANYLYPVFDVQDTTASEIIKRLDSSMNTPGFYLHIDKSKVEKRLSKKLIFKAEKIAWLHVLAKVADAIDADIEISPGEFKLLPRKNATPAK